MVVHRGIVSYRPTSKWWLLIVPVMLGGAIVFWYTGNRAEAAIGGVSALFALLWVIRGDESTIARARAAAEPFVHRGFVPIDDPARREEMFKAEPKRDSERGGGWLVLLHGVHRNIEITVMLQSCDVHATKRELHGVEVTTLEAAIKARPTPFRVGPPLGIGHRAIERGLKAPLSGFADAALEKKWFMYAGAAASAEWLIPPDILSEPWPTEVWSAGQGVVRATWHGQLQTDRVEAALERLVRAVEWMNVMAHNSRSYA